MQLLSVILYNAQGAVRRVDFRPGRLNIVTGESRTGKGALLTIVDYCLGRKSIQVPEGPITDTVVWYATLWQLDEGQVFIARPAPAAGKASSQQAMLEFGNDLRQPPALEDLVVNTNAATLRTQIGRRIGIEENITDPRAGGRAPLEATLAHAVLLCLQSQNEIASSTTLFHRQGERGIADSLRDTIPYFLGAVPQDQAIKRAQLRGAKHALQRAEAALRGAELAAQTIDVELRALYSEARAVGLIAEQEVTDRLRLVRVLQGARVAPPPQQPRPAVDDIAQQDQYIALERQAQTLRADLGRVMADRALLLDQRDGETDYEEALQLQAGRLASLGLIDAAPESGPSVSPTCPACGHETEHADPTPAALRSSLTLLQAQLENLAEARPSQRSALIALDGQASSLRDQLASTEAALTALRTTNRVTDLTSADGRDFTRGRIDAILSRVDSTDDTELQRLRAAAESAAATVAALEAELNDDEDREQLTSRLFLVGQDMTAYADRLELEHSKGSVRLDLARLTVVTDTERGPIRLERIGSAANWIGYHLATHLALHRYFTRQNRPVPRFLILDQPTQAHYPSDMSLQSGVPEGDADRGAVLRTFRLLYDVIQELSPGLQIIVGDHANLSEPWFRESVEHNWRGGTKLIPADWLS
ncbi:DUF3732 domain-containing protein [Microbispora sp. H10836]|uniref:DUF3732 domain-containing protein n=1 Tax=Microbispora sp. H10836 TaxID=2729106 RepID=UPI00147431E8|nr:DUF3732 domain-containing protein [Microbispora sp. H10836]